MPELPEVEVTRRRIEPFLVGRRLAEVKTTRPSYFFLTPPRTLARKLRGRTAVAMERVGKYMLVRFDDDRRLLIHLGMTGQLFSSEATSVRLLSATARASLAPEEQPSFEPDVHTHLQLHFEDRGPEVYMRDVRKFGKLLLLESGETDARLEKLGVDALDVTAEELFAASRGRKVPIKGLLLDQSVLAGVGNIYADESLFLAGVRPARRAARITRRECEGLITQLKRVLERSIETGGSSISDYVSPDGSDGGYQDERQVYGRTGEDCLTCQSPIKRTVVAGRGTHYCPACQR